MGVANALQKCCTCAAEVWQRCGSGVAKRPPLRPRKGLHNRCLAPAPRCWKMQNGFRRSELELR
eukprot:11137023-Alexandrium_andersonii.AAC.1